MDDPIKSMKLYSALDRISKELALAGYPSGPVPMDVLVQFDQLHYHGTSAVDKAIRCTKIASASRVLDIGSGYGGPARWIAKETGAHVDAVELQADLSSIATGLTERTGLSNKVSLIQGDILETKLEREHYDSVISFLALYHIPNRPTLFPRIQTTLKPGGLLYVEDLYILNPPTPLEQTDLDKMMHANTLVTEAAYREEITDAGLTIVEWQDTTKDWAAFTADRLRQFRANRVSYESVHGRETYASLEQFYSVIAKLLAGGNVGGVCYTAQKV